MAPLTFTVIEIAPQDGFTIIRVQLGSTSNDVSSGDAFSITCTNEIAALNAVDSPLVLSA